MNIFVMLKKSKDGNISIEGAFVDEHVARYKFATADREEPCTRELHACVVTLDPSGQMVASDSAL